MKQSPAYKYTPALFGLAILLVTYFGIHLMGTLAQSYQNYGRIELMQQKVEDLKGQRDALMRKRDAQKGEQFVEREARDKLALIKPHETVVVFPALNAVLSETDTTTHSASSASGLQKRLQRWVNLFWR